MNKKRNLFLAAAACGLTALTACSPNWVAGDMPDRYFVNDPVPVPEAKPEAAKPEAAKPEAAKPVIPEGETIPTTPDLEYTVQKGETLAVLASIFGIPEKEIAVRNGLAVSAKLTEGQSLFIPADKITLKKAQKTADVKNVPAPQKEEPKKEPVKEPAKEPAPLPADKTVIHVVKSGDMLSKLAVKYKVSYFEIAKANNIDVNSTLRIGQKLVIPQGKAKKPAAKTAAKPAVKKPAAKPAAKTPAAAPEKKPAAPIENKAVPAAKTETSDDIFSSNFDGASAETPAPAAKPAVKKVKKIAVESWDIMVVKAPKNITLDEFAKQNSRSAESVLVLNPALSADQEIAAGTEVKIFIDPDRQQ